MWPKQFKRFLTARCARITVDFSCLLYFVQNFLQRLLTKFAQWGILRHQHPKMEPETRKRWRQFIQSPQTQPVSVDATSKQEKAIGSWPQKITNRFRMRSPRNFSALFSCFRASAPCTNAFSELKRNDSCDSIIRNCGQPVYKTSIDVLNCSMCNTNTRLLAQKEYAKRLQFVLWAVVDKAQ